ncbi:basic salivary proline-rich protein 1-like [Athalia rosae]|uniref:basic salivary proline-rich protein 1-like n=1 Tax=Athalia rosae TaxID=37344 RepID=UPI00203462C1|nr:basic salivary proline-rich protein 1-like [Athalia rosae]
MIYFYLSALLSIAAAQGPDIEATQFTYPQREQDGRNLWDRIDIHQLDKQLAAWHNEPVSEEKRPVIEPEARQGYGDVPRPIPPIQVLPTAPHPPLPQGCLAPRGQFPSPRSCAHYLNCWDDVVIEQQCPGGLLFNELTGVCDFEYNVYCAGRPAPPPKPELPPGSKVCPEPNGRYRSSTNCSEFYVCVYRKPVKYSCPRGLVYNEDLGVCDYPFRVDCRGAAVPPTIPPTHPTQPPTKPPTRPTQPPTKPPTYPTQPPTYPTHPPTRPTPPPTRPPTHPTQPPTRPTLPPTRPPTYPTPPPNPSYPNYPPQIPPQPQYPPQHPPQPQYPPQQPQYPQQPQQPQYPYPPQQPHYPSHPPQYLPQQPQYPPHRPQYPQYPQPPQQPPYNVARTDPDPWHQRPVASEIELQEEKDKIAKEQQQQILQQLSQQGVDIAPLIFQEDAPQKPPLLNPWGQLHVIPAQLDKIPCKDGDIHRLTDSCSSVVVCRKGRPQLVRCNSPETYDRVSDSCRPFTLAKC